MVPSSRFLNVSSYRAAKAARSNCWSLDGETALSVLMWARLSPMTTQVVNTHEAKSRLSELIRMVEAGDEVIVARGGTPVAKLIAWPERRPVRQPGRWRGQVIYSGDLVGSDAEVVALFDESAAQ